MTSPPVRTKNTSRPTSFQGSFDAAESSFCMPLAPSWKSLLLLFQKDKMSKALSPQIVWCSFEMLPEPKCTLTSFLLHSPLHFILRLRPSYDFQKLAAAQDLTTEGRAANASIHTRPDPLNLKTGACMSCGDPSACSCFYDSRDFSIPRIRRKPPLDSSLPIETLSITNSFQSTVRHQNGIEDYSFAV